MATQPTTEPLTPAQNSVILLTGNLPTPYYNGSHTSINGGTFTRIPNDLDEGATKIVMAEARRVHQRENGRRAKCAQITFDGTDRQEKVRNRLRAKLGLPPLE